MEAAPKAWDPFSLMTLTGEKLLLLRIRLGGEVRDIVEAELDRRAGVAPTKAVPRVNTPLHRRRGRGRGLSAA